MAKPVNTPIDKPQDSRTISTDLKVGDRLSETQYYKVVGFTTEHSGFLSIPMVKVENERGFPFSIARDIIAEGTYSASQYSTEVKVTKTAMVGILEGAGDSVFTCAFHKQLKAADVAKEIMEAAETGSIRDLNRVVTAATKKAIQGEERVLVGYRIGGESHLGRSHCVDLNLPRGTETYDKRVRQVDHRTLKWIILRGVKYTLKK